MLALAAVVGLAVSGCATVEDHEGGLFAPFTGGVVQQAGDGEAVTDGGGMELPDPEDFVPEDPTPMPEEVVVDTGGPPAVVVGDDDDSAGGGALDADAAVEAVTPAEPVVIEPATPVPVIEPATPVPTPVQTNPVLTVPVQTVPVQTLPAPSTSAPTSEAALAVSAPLSEILLVASIPDSSPPRAIVRFPSGDERVVQVGDLLGDSGAKVILIGAGFIKLAELTVDEPDRPQLVTHYLHRMR